MEDVLLGALPPRPARLSAAAPLRTGALSRRGDEGGEGGECGGGDGGGGGGGPGGGAGQLGWHAVPHRGIEGGVVKERERRGGADGRPRHTRHVVQGDAGLDVRLGQPGAACNHSRCCGL